MKIAVTYDHGSVWQHFGHTETFKVYEVADGKVVSAQVVPTTGGGHDLLAGMLDDIAIDVLICGGIGGGAQAALDSVGIQVISGVEGNADDAVLAFLRGELVSAGVNCDHHHEEEGGCHCGDDGEGCGGGCHCGGACHSTMEGRNVGKTCRVHYRGTLNDGTQFDSSYDRGEPLEFVCGAGMMIRGFDRAVADMEVGQTVSIHLMPEEAYGYPDPRAVFAIEIAMLPGAEDVEVGQRVYLYDNSGRPVPVTVIDKDEKNITFDANHEMAGKELNFTIELVSVM